MKFGKLESMVMNFGKVYGWDYGEFLAFQLNVWASLFTTCLKENMLFISFGFSLCNILACVDSFWSLKTTLLLLLFKPSLQIQVKLNIMLIVIFTIQLKFLNKL